MQARHAEPQTYLKSDLPDIVHSFNRKNALEATSLTTSVIPSQKWFWILIMLVLSSVSCPAVVSRPPCATGCCCLQDPVTGDGEHPANNYLYPDPQSQLHAKHRNPDANGKPHFIANLEFTNCSAHNID